MERISFKGKDKEKQNEKGIESGRVEWSQKSKIKTERETLRRALDDFVNDGTENQGRVRGSFKHNRRE